MQTHPCNPVLTLSSASSAIPKSLRYFSLSSSTSLFFAQYILTTVLGFLWFEVYTLFLWSITQSLCICNYKLCSLVSFILSIKWFWLSLLNINIISNAMCYTMLIMLEWMRKGKHRVGILRIRGLRGSALTVYIHGGIS